jgi:hypothetical protein
MYVDAPFVTESLWYVVYVHNVREYTKLLSPSN